MADGHLIGGDRIDENNPLAVVVGSGPATEGEVLTADGAGGTEFRSGSSSVDVIADTNLTAAAAAFDFTSIPATYASLLLVLSGRVDAASIYEWTSVQFNGDVGTNYDWSRYMQENGSEFVSQSLAQTAIRLAAVTGASTTAGRRAHLTLWVPDYADTTFHKTCHAEFHYAFTSAGEKHGMGKHSGLWANTAAIDRLKVSPAAGNFIAGSRATLYGVKGA